MEPATSTFGVPACKKQAGEQESPFKGDSLGVSEQALGCWVSQNLS